MLNKLQNTRQTQSMYNYLPKTSLNSFKNSLIIRQPLTNRKTASKSTIRNVASHRKGKSHKDNQQENKTRPQDPLHETKAT